MAKVSAKGWILLSTGAALGAALALRPGALLRTERGRQELALAQRGLVVGAQALGAVHVGGDRVVRGHRAMGWGWQRHQRAGVGRPVAGRTIRWGDRAGALPVACWIFPKTQPPQEGNP